MSESVSEYKCYFDRYPIRDGMTWQVTQTPSSQDKNWPINWSRTWLMTLGSRPHQNQLRICIRYKFLAQIPAPRLTREQHSCFSHPCDVESSYQYANIILIIHNSYTTYPITRERACVGCILPIIYPLHVTMIVSWWNLCSPPPGPAGQPGLSWLSSPETPDSRVRAEVSHIKLGAQSRSQAT